MSFTVADMPSPEREVDDDAPRMTRGSTTGADCVNCPFSRVGRPNQPVTGEGWERPNWIIIGEGPGQTEVMQGRPFCLTPDTPVLMADLTWKPIGDIVAGDQVLGVDEQSNSGRGASKRSARKWHVAKVTATHRRIAEVIEVQTDNGVLRGSTDHPVLVRKGGYQRDTSGGSGATRWLEIGKLQTGQKRTSRIVYVTPPWVQRTDYWAAWLSGFFDGEGHVLGSKPERHKRTHKRKSDGRIGFSQNAGPTCERAIAAVHAIGYEINTKQEQRTKGMICNRVMVAGGLTAAMRFLGEVRPERLITDFQVAIENKAVRGIGASRVRSRKSIGTGELVDITTTTGTFVANGFIVHNCGASGRLVNEALSKLGVAREAIFVSNATLCQPTQGATDQAKKLARHACAPRLRQELARFPGKPILALGAHAAQQLTGNDKFSITQMAGAFYEVDVDGTGPRTVIPSIHPAAILRGGSSSGGGGSHTVDLAFWNLLYDAQKVNLLAKHADIKFTDDIDVECADPQRAERLIEDFVREARRVKKFACDTETYVDNPKQHTALSPVHARLSAIGLATTQRAISVAWSITTPRARRLLGAIFADSTITKIFHNRIYDVPVLWKHHFTINGPIHCTMLMHHSAFPGLSHQLQRVTTQFYATPPWKAEYRHGQGTLEELLPYNARDTLATARIEAPIAIVMKRSNAERTYEVDLAMAHAATVMHVKGIPVDREVNEHLRTGFRTHIDKARTELVARLHEEGIFARFKERLAFEQARKQRKHDPIDLDQRIQRRLDDIDRKPFEFLIDSGDHIVAFLKACGVPLSLQTPSGRISTKKDILEAFVGYPEVRALLTYRENTKLLSTYIERMFDRVYPSGKRLYGFCDENSRAHPRWSVHKITGRWGSESPVCFDGETEVLTPDGWVRFDQLPQGSPVAQFSKETNEISFIKPTLQFSKLYAGSMVQIAGTHSNLCVTPDHRLLVEKRSGAREDVLAGDFKSDTGQYLLTSSASELRFRRDENPTRITRVPWNGLVYCVSVPESYVVVRRQGQIVIAGQCQNVPKADKKKGRPNLRSQVVAPRGRALVAFDAKQLEARLIALMSGDPFLLSIFHNDKDIHSEFARIVWPDFDTVPVDERKVRRDIIKRPEYGAFYAGSIETLWKSVVRDYPNVTIRMIGNMVQIMKSKMPGVTAWHQNMMRIADRDGEIRSMILGRRRCFPIKQFDLSEVVNFPIQASGADLINLGLMDIMPKLPKDTFPILQIHDAVVFECDEDDQDLVKQLVVESFTREVEYNGVRMNFPVDAKSGPSWDIVN